MVLTYWCFRKVGIFLDFLAEKGKEPKSKSKTAEKEQT
jgi:hypothetical protein